MRYKSKILYYINSMGISEFISDSAIIEAGKFREISKSLIKQKLIDNIIFLLPDEYDTTMDNAEQGKLKDSYKIVRVNEGSVMYQHKILIAHINRSVVCRIPEEVSKSMDKTLKYMNLVNELFIADLCEFREYIVEMKCNLRNNEVITHDSD